MRVKSLSNKGQNLGSAGVFCCHTIFFKKGTSTDKQVAVYEETGSIKAGVARLAAAAGAKRLVLMHFNPLETSDDPVGMPAVRAVFPDAVLGTDSLVIEF